MLLMSDRFTFALWMQSEREKRGWSQSDLSRYSGLHRAIISKIETNVSTPSVETFIALAQAFKISPITIIRKAGLLPEGGDNTNGNHTDSVMPQKSAEITSSILSVSDKTHIPPHAPVISAYNS
jgi:transcriptional regulator with XRE-family HTH domain